MRGGGRPSVQVVTTKALGITVWEPIRGLPKTNTSVLGKMAVRAGKVSIRLLTDPNILVHGKIAINMEMAQAAQPNQVEAQKERRPPCSEEEISSISGCKARKRACGVKKA